MVLHCSDEHFIPGAHVGTPVGLSDQIYGFGRAANKNDLSRTLCVDEVLDSLASAVVLGSGKF